MIIWVRFESHQRYHAVLRVSEEEGVVTWCGRQTKLEYDLDLDRPPACCRACVSKLEHPYLLPAKCRERSAR